MTKMAKVLEEHTVFGEAQGTEFLDPGEQKAQWDLMTALQYQWRGY